MRTTSARLTTVLALLLGLVSLPANAATPTIEGFQSAVMNKGTVGSQYQEAAFNTDMQHLSLAQAAAILSGAVVGGTVADVLLDGTVFTLIGIVIGATLGSEWYERGMWPF